MGQLLCDLGVASRVIRDGRILLVQEALGTHQGQWGLPKGHVEANESPEHAALRELKEETGLEGILMGLVGVRTALRRQGPAVFLCYDVHVADGEATEGDEEIASTAWCSLNELKHLSWVSETMHQLAVDGLTHRSALVNQAGLTPRSDAYAVYRTGQAKSLDGGWLR
jgi:8-oxo-dGTP diphosphatase